jgi:D-alanyl-lipoteichoic acid acyltransferase DltB (MBOAT superfamily)
LPEFDYGRAIRGLRLMLWGFFKKLAVADQLALFVDAVFGHVYQEPGPLLLGASIAFAIQLYCDFSGYTDIARGASEVVGVSLVRNFNNPYAATSVADFWRRWHISLSSWFRDYFFLPLSFALRSYRKLGTYLATFATFCVLGLWHGAAWTYVAMGALSGIYLMASDLTKNVRKRAVSLVRLDRLPFLHRCFQIAFTFCLVLVGWIFFRAHSLSDALYILTHITAGWEPFLRGDFSLGVPFELVGISKMTGLIALSAALFVFLVEWLKGERGVEEGVSSYPKTFRRTLYYAIAFWILWFGFFGSAPFIYFQF